jgi:hypothetical protein
MKTVGKRTKNWVLFGVALVLSSTDAFTQIQIAPVQVSTIGHAFSDPPGPSLNFVRDFLIDQNSGGGALLPSVSANFDINNQFVLTIMAPVGQRFVVRPPDGRSVVFFGSLGWRTLAAPNGTFNFGSVDVSFDGLIGMAPTSYSANSSSLTDTHNYFAFNNIQSAGFTNTFSFTSLTLTATVPSANTGSGTLAYTPEADSGLGFRYETSQTADPGSFVSIVPEPSVGSLLGIALAVGMATRRRSGKCAIHPWQRCLD